MSLILSFFGFLFINFQNFIELHDKQAMSPSLHLNRFKNMTQAPINNIRQRNLHRFINLDNFCWVHINHKKLTIFL